MNNTSKSLLVLAALAALVAAASLWWWYSLVQASAAACVSAAVTPDVGCDHSVQLFVALGSAAIVAVALILVAVKALRSKDAIASQV